MATRVSRVQPEDPIWPGLFPLRPQGGRISVRIEGWPKVSRHWPFCLTAARHDRGERQGAFNWSWKMANGSDNCWCRFWWLALLVLGSWDGLPGLVCYPVIMHWYHQQSSSAAAEASKGAGRWGRCSYCGDGGGGGGTSWLRYDEVVL